jgi:hypothetical protein
MDIGTRIAVAVLSVEMGSVAQAQTTTLSCAGDEATALRQAPLGASRVSLERLTVNWAGGSTVLADSGAQEGYIGGTAYLYCGFSPTSLIVATVSTRIDRGKKTEERDGRSYDSSYCGSGGGPPASAPNVPDSRAQRAVGSKRRTVRSPPMSGCGRPARCPRHPVR